MVLRHREFSARRWKAEECGPGPCGRSWDWCFHYLWRLVLDPNLAPVLTVGVVVAP